MAGWLVQAREMSLSAGPGVPVRGVPQGGMARRSPTRLRPYALGARFNLPDIAGRQRLVHHGLK